MAAGSRPDGDLLFVGLTRTPIGWFLLAFAVGTRCEPTPCPSLPVLLGLLGVALAGTAVLGIYVVRRLEPPGANGS